jgi:hypothetical protein
VVHQVSSLLLVQQFGSTANYYLPTILAVELKDNGISGKFRADEMLTYCCRKSILPVIVFEVAHGQSEGLLLEAGTRWLKGSNGQIRTAILLKLDYPGPITEIKLWVFRLRYHSNESRRRINRWGPKTIWISSDGPLPKPNLSLELSMEDIFGEYMDKFPSDHPYRSLTVSMLHLQPKKEGQSEEEEIMNSIARNPFLDESSEESDQDPHTTTSGSETEREGEPDSDYEDSGDVSDEDGVQSSPRLQPGRAAKRKRTE